MFWKIESMSCTIPNDAIWIKICCSGYDGGTDGDSAGTITLLIIIYLYSDISIAIQ